MIRISREQARRFLLRKHGLLGAPSFRGKDGVREYIAQAGCVQYDSIDVCGKSHELALLARVKGFSRAMLDEMLYTDRTLIDFYDKNMCLLCAEDWPSLGFLRQGFRLRAHSGVQADALAAQVLNLAHQRGSLTAAELDALSFSPVPGHTVLETLFFRGDMVIHHRNGTQKSYAPAADCLPADLLRAPCPFRNDFERKMWQVLRRISAVGLLWNLPSDAWLGVDGLSAPERGEVFAALERVGAIAPVEVEELSAPLFLPAEDLPLLSACRQPASGLKRAVLIPPLDCMLWDRRLIDELFGFSYKWEVYTPVGQRRYGYYVLPVLFGEAFAGRVEPVADPPQDALVVRAFWPEPGVPVNNRLLWALEDALEELRHFLGLGRLVWQANGIRDV